MNDYPRTYETDDQVVEAADRILRARYWERIKWMAEEAIEEHPDDEDERREHVEQDVDGDEHVIYTYKQLIVLRFTDHDDAYEEVYGDDEHATRTQIVYFAMLADVMDEIERLLPEDDEDDAEDEEDEEDEAAP